jgi:LDH2 family malate/lactate/ureidoglycolate dehydrogenase
MAGSLHLTAEEGRAYAARVLRTAGFGEQDAAVCADLMVETSLRGVDSHGVAALLPMFAEHAVGGVGREGSAPSLAEDRGATCVVTGGGASGPRTARLALDCACERARRFGVGAAVAREIGYFGALWWSVAPAAEQGLVALATCNAMAFVAPHGGREALHGTNPIAIAFPGEPDPIVVDIRTNTLRMADVWRSVASGQPLPDGAVMLVDGTPITDIAELERVGWEGAVSLPAAGVKGYGLALAVDLLTAGLAGTPIGREIAWETEQTQLAAFFLVLDPAAFGARERFAAAVARLADQVHGTAALDPEQPVRLPGERSAAERRRRLADGIPVDPVLWDRMEERLAGLGVEVPPRPFAAS